MAVVVVDQTVEAPVADVWASWDAFADIVKFNPLLKDSYLLKDSADTGFGALRQCDFSDGKNYIREKIIGYTPQKQLVLDIYEGTVPLKKAIATIDFEQLGPKRSKVTMRMEFEPKMGLIGRMIVPLMKRQFSSNLGQLLAGNAAHVESLAVRAAA